MSGDTHGPGPFTTLVMGVVAVGLIVIAAHEYLIANDYIPTPISRLEERARRAAMQQSRVIQQAPPAAPQTPTVAGVPTTVHSTRVGPSAPDAPLPGDEKSPACKDPRAERRFNPDTGKRSCFVSN